MKSKVKIEKGEKVFKSVVETVNEMVDFIKPTYGPASNKVIIDKFLYKMAVDDGVQIARDFELEDPIKNAIVRLIKQTAIETNNRSKDGTTGALILVQALINEIDTRLRNSNKRDIELELKKALREVKEGLKAQTKQIKSKEHLKNVALTAYDNKEIAEMIADLYFKLGKESVITVDRSPTNNTYTEMAKGISINSGYISPFMVNDQERNLCELKDPYILITDYRLTETKDLLPILQKMGKEQAKNLVVIADNIEQNALAMLAVNHPRIFNPETKQVGSIPSVAIVAPQGEKRYTLLSDIALMTGAKFFSHDNGDKIENAELSDLGRAKKIVVKKDASVIIDPKGKKTEVINLVKAVREAIKNEKNEKEKTKLVKRLAMLTNSVAVIKVGASTEDEQKAVKYKVEDAVNSVKSAFKEGGVPGSGVALATILTSSQIMNAALKEPAKQLRENMGLATSVNLKKDEVQNVVTGKVGNFLEVGVVDPVDTLISGVESAVSICSLLLTSNGILVEVEEKE